MPSTQGFSQSVWRDRCDLLNDKCKRSAMTSLHFSQLFSQAIEDELRLLPTEAVWDAIEIAREYDYETSGEVAELVRWVSDNSTCRFGVQWRTCIDSCNKPCGSDRSRRSRA
jgi:hypothetical protein